MPTAIMKTPVCYDTPYKFLNVPCQQAPAIRGEKTDLHNSTI